MDLNQKKGMVCIDGFKLEERKGLMDLNQKKGKGCINGFKQEESKGLY